MIISFLKSGCDSTSVHVLMLYPCIYFAQTYAPFLATVNQLHIEKQVNIHRGILTNQQTHDECKIFVCIKPQFIEQKKGQISLFAVFNIGANTEIITIDTQVFEIYVFVQIAFAFHMKIKFY